jgi:hypothetical protein
LHRHTKNKNTKNTTFRKKLLPSSGLTVKNPDIQMLALSGPTFGCLPKRRVFSVFIFGVTMQKVLEEVYEDRN